MKTYPLVSCLCVTRNRVDFLARAINCFYSQSYRKKELIIIFEEDDTKTSDYLGRIKSRVVRAIPVSISPKRTLGELRNIAIANSKGDYICQWDDDDWYHRDRIRQQVGAALDNCQPGSILTNWLIFNQANKQAYFSYVRLWEGSILYSKEVLMSHGIEYPAISKREDTEFVRSILNKDKIYPLVAPGLYIYTIHGANTFDAPHFDNMCRYSQQLSSDVSELVDGILEERVSNFAASEKLMTKDILEKLNYLTSFQW